MTVEQSDVVDAIGIEKSSGKVVLTISDHLDWDDTHAHLVALEAKINRYLVFVESGEMEESYPPSKGRTALVDVVTRLPLSEDGATFIEQARAIIESAGLELRSRVLNEADPKK